MENNIVMNIGEDKMFMMKLHTMMMMVFFLMAAIANLPLCLSFISLSSMNRHLPRQQRLAASSSHDFSECFVSSKQRRTILSDSVFFTAVGAIFSTAVGNKAARAADGQLPKLLDQIKEGRAQLEPIPQLINAEKWDSGM
jgi:hypothetical protein